MASTSRQAPLLGSYPDFVCLSRRLIVEVDGPHYQELEQAARDAYRNQVFRHSGFQTLRFPTRAVHEDIDAVVDVICRALSAASPTRPASRATLPTREREETLSNRPPDTARN